MIEELSELEEKAAALESMELEARALEQEHNDSNVNYNRLGQGSRSYIEKLRSRK